MKVKIDNLTKIYPSRNKKQPEDVIAVNGFDFVIEDGMLVGLLGPSGCGKSTTLNLLSGLQMPTSGRIFFGDDEVTNLPRKSAASAWYSRITRFIPTLPSSKT